MEHDGMPWIPMDGYGTSWMDTEGYGKVQKDMDYGGRFQQITPPVVYKPAMLERQHFEVEVNILKRWYKLTPVLLHVE